MQMYLSGRNTLGDPRIRHENFQRDQDGGLLASAGLQGWRFGRKLRQNTFTRSVRNADPLAYEFAARARTMHQGMDAPALRTTNTSPGSALVSSAGSTRESAHATMSAFGCCPCRSWSNSSRSWLKYFPWKRCKEDKFERLLAELAIHRLDMVLADRPLPAGLDVKGYSHRLGECGLTFFAAPALAAKLEGEFPRLLDGRPLLIPGADSAMRGPLLRWLRGQDIHPHLVGEFDDGALMKSFGQVGAGAFPAPTAIATEVAAQYGVVPIGHTDAVKEHFSPITVERKLSHPAALAVSQGAHQTLFGTP